MDATRHFAIFETAAGHCGIAWSAKGVTRFHLPERDPAAAQRAMHRKAAGAEPGDPPPAIARIVAEVRRYFDGETVDFKDVGLNLPAMNALYVDIYDATRGLGWGETTTYGALARMLGRGPEVARDVGQAMAKNPVPLIIPCHRVLAAGGKPGGFSAPGGVNAKVRMLEMEGVSVAPAEPPQRSLAF
ncbi:MAG: methylated-DNA--[protein]-cysteine S-methyltransferase [Rhizobiaceae bacterium]